MTEWAEESAKLQAARRNRGKYKELTHDKDYFKVIAGARLKLEKDTVPAMPCIVREDSWGNLRHVQSLTMPVRNRQILKIQEHAE